MAALTQARRPPWPSEGSSRSYAPQSAARAAWSLAVAPAARRHLVRKLRILLTFNHQVQSSRACLQVVDAPAPLCYVIVSCVINGLRCAMPHHSFHKRQWGTVGYTRGCGVRYCMQHGTVRATTSRTVGCLL